MVLIVATANKDKLREIRSILADTRIEIRSLSDLSGKIVIKEGTRSFQDNAAKKAVTISKKYPNALVMGEDSGLEVDALHGRPGVCSARFAGKNAGYQKNNEKLLRLLRDKNRKERKARFTTVICLAGSGKALHYVKGSVRGEITVEPRGTGGFGYDPLFLVPKYRKTFAELPAAIKNSISHRARALAKLKKFLEAYIAKPS